MWVCLLKGKNKSIYRDGSRFYYFCLYSSIRCRFCRYYERSLKELEAIAAAVVGGCLLTGGYGSAIGAAFGAIIFGTVSMGIFYTDVDTDWFKVFLGAMMLIAVVFNNYIRKKVTESK